jgi:predicted pyridoxine 5'-phosphate oxidase superfamily flavin-nucleotide-binding protein
MSGKDAFYPPAARELQDRFDTRRLADRIVERLVHTELTADDRAFIEGLDMFFLATVDADGHPQCSYKGGAPGFVRVLDERTLAFPSLNGNGMFLTMGNIATTGEVGMLFIDFVKQARFRLNGVATIDPDDPLLPELHEADLVVRVAIREIFPNCPRYIHRMERAESSRFVPREGCATPVPMWKSREWAADVLPAGDPALDPAREKLKR